MRLTARLLACASNPVVTLFGGDESPLLQGLVARAQGKGSEQGGTESGDFTPSHCPSCEGRYKGPSLTKLLLNPLQC